MIFTNELVLARIIQVSVSSFYFSFLFRYLVDLKLLILWYNLTEFLGWWSVVSWVALNFAFVLMLNFDFILICSFKNNVSLIVPPTGKALELDFKLNNFKLNFIKHDNCHSLVQWRINPWEMSRNLFIMHDYPTPQIYHPIYMAVIPYKFKISLSLIWFQLEIFIKPPQGNF